MAAAKAATVFLFPKGAEGGGSCGEVDRHPSTSSSYPISPIFSSTSVYFSGEGGKGEGKEHLHPEGRRRGREESHLGERVWGSRREKRLARPSKIVRRKDILFYNFLASSENPPAVNRL